MQDFRLTSRQREHLRAEVKAVGDPRVVKRIVALLELDQGAPLSGVAANLGVTRQTVYNWTRRFREDGGLPALHDRARRGRPPRLSEPLRRVVTWLLQQPPDAFGYAAVGWTVSLLRDILATRIGMHVSDATLRRALHRLDHAWKRPRYVLRPDAEREKKTQDSPTNRATT